MAAHLLAGGVERHDRPPAIKADDPSAFRRLLIHHTDHIAGQADGIASPGGGQLESHRLLPGRDHLPGIRSTVPPPATLSSRLR